MAKSKFSIKNLSKGLIWLITSTHEGRPCWYYLKVEKTKEKLLEANMGLCNVNLANYGEILHRGWGTEPPQYLQKRMNEE